MKEYRILKREGYGFQVQVKLYVFWIVPYWEWYCFTLTLEDAERTVDLLTK